MLTLKQFTITERQENVNLKNKDEQKLWCFRKAAVVQRYRRSPSPKGDVMSSRPRDMHHPPKFTALIPREPEAKWVASRPPQKGQRKGKVSQKESPEKPEDDQEKEKKGRGQSLANGIKSLCIYVPRKQETNTKLVLSSYYKIFSLKISKSILNWSTQRSKLLKFIDSDNTFETNIMNEVVR